MYTAIVKLDTLTNSVWTATEDHNLRFCLRHRILVLGIVSGIIIRAVFCSTDMDTFPCFFNPKADSVITDFFLRNLQQLAQIFIRETIFLCLDQKCICRQMTFGLKDFFLFLNQFTHLLNKVCLHLGQIENLFCCCTLADSFVHNKMTVTCRINQQM